MASTGNYAAGGDSSDGSLRAARQRRIDDVRQLQQERRRQHQPAVPQQQQQVQHEDMMPMQHHRQQEYQNNSSDANTTIMSSYPSGSGASTSRSPSSTRSGGSSRSRLSAKRQNMMARRIEMRRQNEERERLQQQREDEGELPEEYDPDELQQQQMGAQILNAHSNDNGHGQAVQLNQQHVAAQGQSQPQHFRQQQSQPMPMLSQPQQQYQGQSIMKKTGGNSHSRGHPDFGQSSVPPQPRGQMIQQRQYSQSQAQRPPIQGRPHPQQQHHQHSQSAPYGQQPQQQIRLQPQHQQEPQQQHQYSRTQSHESPMSIPSPPMLHRKQPQYSRIPVYTMGEETSRGNSNVEARRKNQVYNQTELEQSGIIRNNAQSSNNVSNQQHQQPIMNRLRSHDSPSDEWRGHNSASAAGYGMNAGSNGRNNGVLNHLPQPGRTDQYDQSSQHYQQQRPPQHHTQQQLPIRQNAQTGAYHDRVLGGPNGVLTNPSLQGVNLQRDRYPHHDHRQPEPQKQIHQPQSQQYQNQNQPNWNEVNRQYHDNNRQRHYQRQLASRQQYQERAEQQMNVVAQQSQQQQNPPPSLYQSPHRSSRMSTFSPVEHLGNRTEHIQRKHISPSRTGQQQKGQEFHIQHHQQQQQQHVLPPPPNVHYTIEGEESIISVSEQARKFEKAAGRSQGQMSVQMKQQLDEETVSVASIRKGWEGKSNMMEQQQQSRPEQQQRPKPSSIIHKQETPNSPFGVWEERANRLARLRRREQRREQKKHIEDRWMNQRSRNNVKSLPPGNVHQDGHESQLGYQSEGEPRLRDSHSEQPDGYQSEGGQRTRYHDGLDESMEEQGLEVQYEDTLNQLEVDSAAITPSDARRRLWDQKERLRAVLPKNESFDGGNVMDRWMEHHPDGNGKMASPSSTNYSESSGGLFKSKFVHAAALATQQRRANMQREDDAEQNDPQWEAEERAESQKQKQPHHVPNNETRQQHHQQRSAPQQPQQQSEYAESRHHRRQQAVPASQQPQQQHREYASNKKNYFQKGEPNSSLYTDSTAETTDITTTPGGSHGSSHHVQQQSSNALRTSNSFVRQVSPSPSKRPSAQQRTMPPISEQGTGTSPQQRKETQQASSVVALIARINAVSRSNPEEALAAIDSIIKREGVGGGVSGNVVGSSNNPQEMSRNNRPPPNAAAPAPTKTLPFSPSRNEITPTSSPNKAKNNNTNPSTAVRHLGKDFFQEKYEEVLRNDSERIIPGARGAAPAAPSEIRAPSTEMQDHGEYDDDEDDSLLSSAESTVSSMTDPTYQSLRSEQLKPKDRSRRNAVQPPDYLQPQKSWNTLKREYTVRKESPPRHSHRDELNGQVTASEEEIGLDNFHNPDDIIEQLQQQQKTPTRRGVVDYGHRGQHQQQHQPSQQQQPQDLVKTGTNDFKMGICGVNCVEDDAPPTPSTMTNSAWEPIPKNSFGNASNEKRLDVAARGRVPPPMHQGRAVTTTNKKPQERTGGEWPFAGATAPRKNATSQQQQQMPVQLNRMTAQRTQPTTRATVPRHANTAQPPKNNRNTMPEQHHATTIPRNASRQRPIQTNRTYVPRQANTAPQNRNMPEHTTPEPNRNTVQKKRASTPEIMMAVSDAFSDVDISLEGGTTANSTATAKELRPIPSHDDDPPLQNLDSSEDEAERTLQTISEAFSDVDVSFGKEKSASQRRKELEYLAKSWTASKSQSNDDGGSSSSSSFMVPPPPNGGVVASQAPKAAIATWAKEISQKKSSQTTKLKKKVGEPTLRLKGNKSLAKKFASLVRAYDD